MNKPELLLPAGSLASLKTAFLYGADAVYAGAPEISLRAKSKFPLADISEGIEFAHKIGKKVYLAINIFSHNKDIERLQKVLPIIKDTNPDAIIISDPGIFSYIKKELPKLPLHVSTQANVCSWITADFWKNLGADTCVLGRETTFAEACEIRKKIPEMKFEIFVHGSMCISYSGRCLLSAFMSARSANAGACAHSCRWKYKSKLILEEELRPGEYLEMSEDENGSYILNSKDLCLMPKLDKILSAGFNSLKIEGRNKSEYYAAQTARVYRKAIDDYYENPDKWQPDLYMKELLTLQNRGYTLGFFDGIPDDSAQDYIDTSSKSLWRNAGTVISSKDSLLEVEIRHKMKKGDKIEILSPYKFEPVEIILDEIFNGSNSRPVAEMSAGKPNQTIKFPVSDPSLFPQYTVIRIKQE
ncbi:MAG: U32 family peptidase C-terminal domain-containing protein [Elusimicrobiota bacterium]|jgi:putative protease|nr:U32 family peptidase C-terminal domain-containing protein [Elusimicrobiota bacterium]